jgi:hypothetical protein
MFLCFFSLSNHNPTVIQNRQITHEKQDQTALLDGDRQLLSLPLFFTTKNWLLCLINSIEYLYNEILQTPVSFYKKNK